MTVKRRGGHHASKQAAHRPLAPERIRLSTRTILICLVGTVLTLFHIQTQLFSLAQSNDDQHDVASNEPQPKKSSASLSRYHTARKKFRAQQRLRQQNRTRVGNDSEDHKQQPCAINLFGLPRAFESLVLPSLRKHVIATNPGCDYFVHYYNLTEEARGQRSTRATKGGLIHAEQVLQLKQAVHEVNPHATVQFSVTQEAEFWSKHDALLQTIHTTTDPRNQNKSLYFPWKARTYKFPSTIDNIIKMWHSIQEAWNLMKRHQTTSPNKYVRVAMIRSDVVYLTPVRIWEIQEGQVDTQNKAVVIPSFARYPVNDRLVYGPYDAVEQWAAHRFDRLKKHVEWVSEYYPGWGMHSERFVAISILPSLKKDLGYTVVPHERLCFLRARVDESVWISDCWGRSNAEANPQIAQALFDSPPGANLGILKADLVAKAQPVVERVLGRACPGPIVRVRASVYALKCAARERRRWNAGSS